MRRQHGSRPALLALLAVMVVLTPLAYASPPDPSWIRGVYDLDDFDDVVVLVTSAPMVVDGFPVCGVGPQQMVAELAPSSDQGVCPAGISSPTPNRGPPAAS